MKIGELQAVREALTATGRPYAWCEIQRASSTGSGPVVGRRRIWSAKGSPGESVFAWMMDVSFLVFQIDNIPHCDRVWLFHKWTTCEILGLSTSFPPFRCSSDQRMKSQWLATQ